MKLRSTMSFAEAKTTVKFRLRKRRNFVFIVFFVSFLAAAIVL